MRQITSRAPSDAIYRPKTGGHPGFGTGISIAYFEFKRLEMHSWRPYAKHPTFEFGQRDDGDGKFKVGAQGGDRNTRGDGEGELRTGSCIWCLIQAAMLAFPL
jgi:hypothetical protein